MTRRDLALLLALLCAFVAVRALALQETFAAQSVEPLEFGQLAQDLDVGLLAPLPAYLPQANEGCGLFFGLWCAPAFAVLGDSYLTLRLCHVAWQGAMLLVLLGLALRVGGRWGAAAAGLLFVLPPPGISSLMHRGWFNHLEAWLLLGGALLLHGERRRRAGGAGLLIGLAPFFQLSALPAALGVGGLLLARRPGRRALIAGLALGALPWLAASWLGAPMDGSAASDASFAPAAAAASLGSLLLREGPGALGYAGAGSFSGIAIGRAVGALLVAGALLGGLGRRGRPWTRAAGAAALLHVAACVASGLDLSQGRYLAPLWPWLLVLVAAAPRPALISALLVAAVNAFQLPAPSADRMPPAFEATLKGHSVLRHDGLRHGLDPAGAAVARRFAAGDASWDLCRHLGREGAALPPGPSDAECSLGFALGSGEAQARADDGDPVAAGAPDEAPAALAGRRWLGWFGQRLGHGAPSMDAALDAAADPRLACLALGHWAFETGWYDTGPGKRAAERCGAPLLAAGAGLALAPRLRGQDVGAPGPQLRWWWSSGPVSARAQAAFLCGFDAERRALGGGETAALPLDCAP